MAGMICLVDASKEKYKDYYTLGLWGKPVIWYPIHAAQESGLFDRILVNSYDSYVKYLIQKFFDDSVVIGQAENSIIIDGRAALLTSDGIKGAIQKVNFYGRIDLLRYVDEEQATIVHNELTFELVLSMLRKRNRNSWMRRDVLQRIAEKGDLFSNTQANSICFVGHSQLDQWSIQNLCGFSVRNCAINGITAKEYIYDVLEKDLLSYNDKAYLVLIGVNELVLPISVQTVTKNINDLIFHIKDRSCAPLFFIEPLYVNGRLDRNNAQIDMLRNELKQSPLYSTVYWINSDPMNDAFGHLNYEYTTDGLHLNAAGYTKLQNIVTTYISKWKGNNT